MPEIVEGKQYELFCNEQMIKVNFGKYGQIESAMNWQLKADKEAHASKATSIP